MAVDVFSLRGIIELVGGKNVAQDLRTVEEQGVKTAGSLNRIESAALNGTKGFREIPYAAISASEAMGTAAGQTAKVEEATTKATKAQKEHVEGLRGMLAPLRQLAEAYLVFEAIDFVGDAIEQAAALHELSQKTGASVEMLSMLEFAGRRADVSVGTLRMGFRGLSLSLDNLRDGQKNAVQAFAEIGLSAKDFVGINTDQAFMRIVQSMAPMTDGLEKSEVAARIFGRSGAEMIPLLDDLAKNGFAKTREEAEKFHAIISEKVSKDADDLKDRWNDLKFVFTDLARMVIPPLTTALRELVSLMQQGPGDTWRNTWRELAAIADVFTGGMATKYFPSRQNQFGDVEGGSSSANFGDRGTTPPPKPLTDSEKNALLRRLEAAEGSPLRAGIDDDVWARYPMRTDDLRVRGGLIPGQQTAPQPGQRGDNQEGYWFDAGKFAANAFFRGLAGPTGESPLSRWQNSLVAAAGSVQRSFANLGTNLGQTLAGGFAAAMNAGVHGKNIFKAFGNAILQGLGNIFTQMGAELLTYGLIMLNLLPFLSNPFTSGFAAIAAGTALIAAGTILGGIATGSGGRSGGAGGGAASFDRTTQITLTADGAGGFKPATAQVGPTIQVLGVKTPQGARILAEGTQTAARLGHRIG